MPSRPRIRRSATSYEERLYRAAWNYFNAYRKEWRFNNSLRSGNSKEAKRRQLQYNVAKKELAAARQELEVTAKGMRVPIIGTINRARLAKLEAELEMMVDRAVEMAKELEMIKGDSK